MIVNTSQLTEIFRITVRTLTTWIAEGVPVIHRGGDGRGDESAFDVGDVHRWILARAVAKVERTTPDARLKELQAQKLEMEIARDSGELVFAADMEKLLTDGITVARNELLALPDRLKATLDGMYRINLDPELVLVEVLGTLNRIAAFGEAIEADDDEGEPSGPSPQTSTENENDGQ